jgi:hypothetical protein
MRPRSRTTLKQEAPTAPRKRVAVSAVDSLRANESMVALMPTVARLTALQKDCVAILPDMFGPCAVLRLDSDRLILSAPNAAMAVRLKQQLPILQDSLLTAGWQVSAISLKVQPLKNAVESRRSEKVALPPQAVEAFANLVQMMEKTPQNEALRTAIGNLVRHHGDLS